MQIVGVTASGFVQRNVDVETGAFSLADEIVIGFPQMRPGVSVFVSVNGKVKHSRIVVKGILGPVSVVHVPVDDENALNAQIVDRVLRGENGVVEITKTAEVRLHGVVSGGSDQCEGVFPMVGEYLR